MTDEPRRPIKGKSVRHDLPFTDIPEQPDGFDVTVETVIGRVTVGDFGHPSPIHGAFAIIADHILSTGKGADGVYRFPGPHEDSETVVTVEGSE